MAARTRFDRGWGLTLTNNIKALTTASMNGTGNGHGDVVTGNAGLNVLDGNAGRDALTVLGDTGTFLFRVGQTNGDVVTDFTGAGPGEGDIPKFVGFGAGSQVHSPDISHSDWYIISNAAHGGPAAAETIQVGRDEPRCAAWRQPHPSPFV